MPSIKTRDGVEICYKDWGKGQPIVPNPGYLWRGAIGFEALLGRKGVSPDQFF